MFHCAECDYTTDRKDTLKRHKTSRHMGPVDHVNKIIDSVLKQVKIRVDQQKTLLTTWRLKGVLPTPGKSVQGVTKLVSGKMLRMLPRMSPMK